MKKYVSTIIFISIIVISVLMGVRPVSYTHLDVYKRQAQYTVAESLYDVAVNRMNSFGDSLLEEGINRINLLENSE